MTISITITQILLP